MVFSQLPFSSTIFSQAHLSGEMTEGYMCWTPSWNVTTINNKSQFVKALFVDSSFSLTGMQLIIYYQLLPPVSVLVFHLYPILINLLKKRISELLNFFAGNSEMTPSPIQMSHICTIQTSFQPIGTRWVSSSGSCIIC